MSLVSVNPATGRKINTYREHTAAQIDAALAHTHAAFQGWRELSLSGRTAHLHAVAAELRRDQEALARLIVAEVGKPITQARLEVEKCANTCDYYARHARRYLRPDRPLGAPKHARVVFEPLGVILAIMPWNYPFWQAFRCAAPALMAGNTVLLKHAANVSGCALAIEEVFKRAGTPAGIFRSVLCGIPPVGDLIADPRIRAISLTGSTQAGRKVAAQAGAVLKPCIFELGGSDPYLVLEDADIAHAARTCATARLINGGQSCISAKRLIVVESVRAEFETLLLKEITQRTVGDPAREDTDIGPLAREDLRTNLHSQVTRSVKAGARLLLGGKIPDGPGWYYPPTILTEVKPGMPAHDEELFGPVAAIVGVPDEEAAIATANATPYGLGAAVFTRNRRRGQVIAEERLDAGMAFVNDYVRSDPTLPFGGIKESGYGKELGRYGILALTNHKTVWVK